jgi:hypothetical protein
MKKMLLITSLLFISCIYAQPKSLQSGARVQKQQEVSPLRLDRISTINFDGNSIIGKYEEAYDAKGNQTLDIQYNWNTTTQSFVPSDEQEYAYDTNGNRTLINGYSWNTTTQSFVPNYKQEYTYDANGNQTLYISYSWNTTTQSFVPSDKQESTFDANGNQTLYINYSWNTTTQSFVPNYKEEYTFDANGNQTLYIFYYWDATIQSFIPSDKQESTYDANGNQISIQYSWNTTTKSFILDSKLENTYDANGNGTLSIFYIWNTITKSFILDSKWEYTYDANGNQTFSIWYLWNITTKSYVRELKFESTYDAKGNQTLSLSIRYSFELLNFKEEFAYDVNGNKTLDIKYTWDTSTKSFVPVSKEIRTYSDGSLISVMMYKWYPELGVYKPSFKTEYATILDTTTQLHRMGVTYQYETNFNVWEKLEGEEFTSYAYYTKTASLSSPSQTIENNIISLYPNPTSQMLNISHPELNSLGIQIVDLNGKQMYSGTIQKDVPLDVSTYSPGMYLVTIDNKETNKKNTYKIIKK